MASPGLGRVRGAEGSAWPNPSSPGKGRPAKPLKLRKPADEAARLGNCGEGSFRAPAGAKPEFPGGYEPNEHDEAYAQSMKRQFFDNQLDLLNDHTYDMLLRIFRKDDRRGEKQVHRARKS